MVNIQKCAVIGCGFVGASTAFALLQSGLFQEIILIDVNKDRAVGEAMDLNHGASFTSTPVKVKAGEYRDISDCGLVIITAGANQKPEQTRLDLVKQNSKIMKSIVSEIIRYNKECILLVVSNPVDVLTYVAYRTSGFPANRVIGSGTVLDTARLKYLLGKHFSVDSRSIHAFIIGEHGDSELAVFSSANVSGIDLSGFKCPFDGSCNIHDLDNIYKNVVNSAYEIISKKGATYYAIALGVKRICESIVKNQHSILPVSVLVDGHYGLNNMYLGIPSIVGKDGAEKVLDIPLNDEEREKLISSAKTLSEVISNIDI